MKGVHWIDTGQWPAACCVVKDETAYRRVMEQYCGKGVETRPWPQRHGGFCQALKDDAGSCVIVIGFGKQTKAELALTAAHEATHAMRWILEHAAESEPGTETEAYLVEHIMRGALKALAKR